MGEVCVQVAVRIRPMLATELLHNHQVSVRLIPGSAQVMLGLDRVFSFDHAFGPTASQNEVYESCVQPLVKSLVDGYNATVFCYGQTGSGKTYTLGGGNLDEKGGLIDCVAQDLFLLLGGKGTNGDGVEATVQVSYMELYMEELRDLMELHTVHKDLHIREDENGNTVVMGAKQKVVGSAEELLSIVEMGNALRHTGTTGMNEHSSRSHAILTLQLIQCCRNKSSKSIRFSKLCLVDLAGSERAGKTGNTGMRLKESVHINTDLLALGNVIRALSDPGRNRCRSRCNSAHIPYRDAKITRLLRDSLGGTAHTLMVACVSPSDHSIAETLGVLQFASKARHIRNHPTDKSTHTDGQLSPTTWDPSGDRRGELEYEVQTLRELLKEKEKNKAMKWERTGGALEEGHSTSQYCLLAQEALLADISSPTPSHSLGPRLQDWEERLTAVSGSHQANDEDCSEAGGDQHNLATISNLREELNKYKEALTSEEQLLEQKDAELRCIQRDVEKLLQVLQEEKGRNRIQTEQLVDQEILISRLRNKPLTVGDATSEAAVEAEASGNTGKRPHRVTLIRPSCDLEPTRKIIPGPLAHSLERVMAAFKVRGHLLLAEADAKDEVCCPFTKQQTENTERDQQEERVEDNSGGKMGLRHSLNQTWTCRQNKEKNSEQGQTSNGSPSARQSQKATGTKENHAEQSHMKNARASVTQRMIRDLSVNICLKEDLIKELDKTDKETQALVSEGRHSVNGSEAGVLKRLSFESQQVQAEVYRSLRHMRVQRAQLQTSLEQQRQISDKNKQLEEQRAGDMIMCPSKLQEPLKEKLHAGSWLEEEEEPVLQRRAELQELEEELKRREEVLLRRGACLQQKNNLEFKMLCTSQARSQDLLNLSMQLDSLEEQLQRSSSGRQTQGVTIKELEEERDMLKERRDTLDGQLKDNRLLSVEEENSLLQLEEAIEALDAALEFKNRSIHDKQKKLLVRDSSSCQSQSSEPTQLCNVIRKLKELTAPEASKLLVKYFKKVISLREADRHLRLRCEELDLQVGEKDVMLREQEIAMQRLTLEADRRLTQQHRDHQNKIQLLLQNRKEGGSGEEQQAIHDRLQRLEKDLFFYKSTCRHLKRKLKECPNDTPQTVDEPSHSQKPIQVHTEHTEMPRSDQIHTQSQRERVAEVVGQRLQLTPVRLCRRELRQIPSLDLQVCGSTTRRRQSVSDTSSESILEDLEEVPDRITFHNL